MLPCSFNFPPIRAEREPSSAREIRRRRAAEGKRAKRPARAARAAAGGEAPAVAICALCLHQTKSAKAALDSAYGFVHVACGIAAHREGVEPGQMIRPQYRRERSSLSASALAAGRRSGAGARTGGTNGGDGK